MSGFSTRFKKMRNKLNLSQEEMALTTECSRTKITGFEKKDPDYISFFSKLCSMYNINLNWLLGGIGSMFINSPNEALKEELRRELEELFKKKGL